VVCIHKHDATEFFNPKYFFCKYHVRPLLLASEVSGVISNVTDLHSGGCNWFRVPLEKLIVAHLAKKSYALYGTRLFNYFVHKNPLPGPLLSQINSVHTFPPYFSKIHSSFHLYLILPSTLFPSGFPTKILHAFLISPWFDPINNIW